MHASKILLMLVIMGGVVFSVNAAVPNQRAVVSAIATQQCGCNEIARVRVDSTVTNSALQAMGIANIHISSATAYVSEKLKGGPHNGTGDGRSTAIQIGVATVTTDATGNIDVSIEFESYDETTQCNSHTAPEA